MDNTVTRRDALEFPDGQVILLTRLCEDRSMRDRTAISSADCKHDVRR